jgi:hypothetical protein
VADDHVGTPEGVPGLDIRGAGQRRERAERLGGQTSHLAVAHDGVAEPPPGAGAGTDQLVAPDGFLPGSDREVRLIDGLAPIADWLHDLRSGQTEGPGEVVDVVVSVTGTVNEAVAGSHVPARLVGDEDDTIETAFAVQEKSARTAIADDE